MEILFYLTRSPWRLSLLHCSLSLFIDFFAFSQNVAKLFLYRWYGIETCDIGAYLRTFVDSWFWMVMFNIYVYISCAMSNDSLTLLYILGFIEVIFLLWGVFWRTICFLLGFVWRRPCNEPIYNTFGNSINEKSLLYCPQFPCDVCSPWMATLRKVYENSFFLELSFYLRGFYENIFLHTFLCLCLTYL